MPASYTAANSGNAYIRSTLVNIGSSANTLCMWVYLTSMPSAGSYRGALGGWTTGSDHILVREGTPDDKFQLWANGSSAGLGGAIFINTWYFIAQTFSSSGSGVLKLFEGTTPSNLTNSVTSGSFNPASVVESCFGGYATTDSSDMDGQICHCQFFNVALTLEQLKEVMCNPGSLTVGGALKGYFHMLSSPTKNLTAQTNATENAAMSSSTNGPGCFMNMGGII